MTSSPTRSSSGIAGATRFVLPNGLVALIQRNPHSPTVSVRGDVGIGSVHEPADKGGLATFTGAALIRGAGQRSFQEIVAETEALGCSVNAGGGQHGTGFGAKALSEDLPLVLEILADMVQRPTFPEHEIERLRGQFLMGLRENEQETRYQASRAIRSMLYPSDHPYSRLSSGTVESVSAITRDDLIGFQSLFQPNLTRIAIVGDVEPEAVKELLERTFGGWQVTKEPLSEELPPVPALNGIRRQDIVLEGKVQSDIFLCTLGLKRKDPDYYAAMLANLILGSIGMGGRLGENVRENQGMAYSVFSGFDAGIGAGPWTAAAGVHPANIERAIAAILHEIEQFKQDGPTELELSDARAYLTGSVVLTLETNDGIAGTLLGIERFDLGLDYIDRYPEIINAVSREAIVEAARRYFSTENYVLATAGPQVEEAA